MLSTLTAIAEQVSQKINPQFDSDIELFFEIVDSEYRYQRGNSHK